MKKLNLNGQLLLLTIISVISGCEQTESSALADEYAIESSSLKITLVPKYEVDGILHFDSPSELEEMRKYLLSLSVSERKVWEESNNFKSLRRIIEEAYESIDNAESVEELYDIVKKHDHLLEIRDSSIMEKNIDPFYQVICNEDGLFSTSTFINEICDGFYYAYNLDNFKTSLSTTTIDPIEIRELISTTSVKKSAALYNLEKVYTRNESGCSNDRRVYITSTFSAVYGTWTMGTPPDQCSFTEYTPQLKIIVKGHKRKFCIWRPYKTSLSLRNVAYNITGFDNDQNKVFGAYIASCSEIIPTESVAETYPGTWPTFDTDEDDYQLVKKQYVGERALNENSQYLLTLLDINSIHAEGSSRGIGSNWAIIDEVE